MYKYGEVGQILVFKAYNVIAKLGIIYAGITKYSDLLLLDKRQSLFARNLAKKPKIAAKQTCVYEEVLKPFILQIWSNNELASLKFSIIWRQWLAKVVFEITSVE